MMSGVPLETRWAFNKLWNNKFYYKVASCWYFYWVILRCTDPWISKIDRSFKNILFWRSAHFLHRATFRQNVLPSSSERPDCLQSMLKTICRLYEMIWRLEGVWPNTATGKTVASECKSRFPLGSSYPGITSSRCESNLVGPCGRSDFSSHVNRHARRSAIMGSAAAASRKLHVCLTVYLTHWGRAGSFKLLKTPFPGFLTILTL